MRGGSRKLLYCSIHREESIAFANYHSRSPRVGLRSGGARERLCGRVVATGIPARFVGFFCCHSDPTTMASTCGGCTTSIRGICGSGAISHDPVRPRLTGQLAMNDPSFKPGDIASTSHGFLVFIGRDGAERRPDDPQRIPQAQAERFRSKVS
jgi:hypothetical protein